MSVEFIDGLTTSDEERASARQHGFRRLMGLLLGAGWGLIYGLVSQYINVAALPGIPLYQPPPGPLVSSVLYTLGGAALGLVCAWPASSVVGAIWGGVGGALVIAALALSKGLARPDMAAGIFVVVAYVFLPIAAMFVIGIGAFRWVVDKQQEIHQAPSTGLHRLLPVGLLILAGIIGTFSKYPPEARQVLSRMNALVQAGQAASDAADLAPALRSYTVERFLENAQGAYGLTWENENLDRFPIPRPVYNPQEQSVAVARFENGWVLVCLFVTAQAEPTCASY